MPFDITKLEGNTIIFGGLTLVALALVWLLLRTIKFFGNHTMNVIEKNTEAWVENTRSNQKLVDVIEDTYKTKKIK